MINAGRDTRPRGDDAMIAAVCSDDRNGMLFNRRRLSRDRAQQEDLLARLTNSEDSTCKKD